MTAPGARSRRYAGAVRPSWPGLSATLVAAIAMSGCGSSGPPKIKTKADFIKAGDTICVQRDRQAAKLTHLTVNGNGDIGKISADLAGIYAKAITKLQALALPPGPARAGAEKYVQSVLALRQPVGRMKTAALQFEKAGRSADVATEKTAAVTLQTSLTTVQSLSDPADENARDYGFKDCGQQSFFSATS